MTKTSRSTRSPAVLAAWPSLSADRTPCADDVRVRVIKYFLLHCAYHTTYEDHPQNFLFGNGIIMAASTSSAFCSASFLPVSRIITHCAIIDRKIGLDFGEDSVLYSSDGIPSSLMHSSILSYFFSYVILCALY